MTRCDGSRTPSSWPRLLPRGTTGCAPAPQAQRAEVGADYRSSRKDGMNSGLLRSARETRAWWQVPEL